jgi:hypothetical protein
VDPGEDQAYQMHTAHISSQGQESIVNGTKTANFVRTLVVANPHDLWI